MRITCIDLGLLYAVVSVYVPWRLHEMFLPQGVVIRVKNFLVLSELRRFSLLAQPQNVVGF